MYKHKCPDDYDECDDWDKRNPVINGRQRERNPETGRIYAYDHISGGHNTPIEQGIREEDNGYGTIMIPDPADKKNGPYYVGEREFMYDEETNATYAPESISGGGFTYFIGRGKIKGYSRTSR